VFFVEWEKILNRMWNRFGREEFSPVIGPNLNGVAARMVAVVPTP
jgi:hypothetical protein